MVQIGEAIELSEGDLVLTFNKTIDLMRQVREMLADVSPEHPLRNGLASAERLLRRGIVEQSLTIGFAPIAIPELPDAGEIAPAAPEGDGLAPETASSRPRRKAKTAAEPAAPARRTRAKQPTS